VHISTQHRRLCLDSIIAGHLYERHRDGPGALAEIHKIIDHWHFDSDTAVPKASQAVFLSPTTEEDVIFYRSISRTVNDSSVRDRILGTKWTNKIRTLERPHLSSMENAYKAIAVEELFYFFCGDVMQIEELVCRAGRIGALRNKGWGEIDVDKVAADELPNDSELFGIICSGNLMRPIPTRCENALMPFGEIQYNVGSIESWCGPYHDPSTKDVCLVPMQSGPHMVKTMAEIINLAK
jgi:hypothetical protein